MEKKDEYMEIEKEIEQHQETDQDLQKKAELGGDKEIGNSQISNKGSDIGIKTKEKKKMSGKDFAYWVMLVFVIITCCVVIYYLSGDARQCLADPLKYYSDRIGQQCYCMQKV